MHSIIYFAVRLSSFGRQCSQFAGKRLHCNKQETWQDLLNKKKTDDLACSNNYYHYKTRDEFFSSSYNTRAALFTHRDQDKLPKLMIHKFYHIDQLTNLDPQNQKIQNFMLFRNVV